MEGVKFIELKELIAISLITEVKANQLRLFSSNVSNLSLKTICIVSACMCVHVCAYVHVCAAFQSVFVWPPAEN